jgi:hypothetical protein
MPLMPVFVLAIIGVSGYIWLTRGFFSALIHLACTIAAGAIAFGVWEPLGDLLLANSPDRGAGTFVRDATWGVALAVPFAAALALLRVATNKLLPFNAQCDKVGDAVGGLICGVASGVITAGFFMMSVGLLRVGPDSLGYTPVSYTTQATARGSVERDKGWVVNLTPRVDLATARLYSYLSRTTLRTGEPLAKWRPELADEIAANRLTFEGKSRNTIKAKDFRVNGWYTIGLEKNDTSYTGSRSIAALLADKWNTSSQGVVDLSGERITSGYVAGFQVQMQSGAREKVGQVIVGSGQVRLVVESVADEEWRTLFPVAVVSAMDVTSLQPGEEPAYARFRFDGTDVYVASAGGASDTVMSFEFAVPSGFKPIGLYVKGTRWEVPEGTPAKHFADPAQRDAEIEARGGVLPSESSAAAAIAPIMVTNALGFTIQSGSERSLEIYSDGGRNWIRDGEAKFPKSAITRAAGLERSLQINTFEVTPDTVIVKVNVSMNSPASLLSEAALSADSRQPLLLVDTNGKTYEPIGFIYRDNEKYHIRYTAGRPIRSLEELAQSGITLSTSRPEQQLELIFRPTFGVKLATFQIGGTVVMQIDPPVLLDQRQK